MYRIIILLAALLLYVDIANCYQLCDKFKKQVLEKQAIVINLRHDLNNCLRKNGQLNRQNFIAQSHRNQCEKTVQELLLLNKTHQILAQEHRNLLAQEHNAQLRLAQHQQQLNHQTALQLQQEIKIKEQDHHIAHLQAKLFAQEKAAQTQQTLCQQQLGQQLLFQQQQERAMKEQGQQLHQQIVQLQQKSLTQEKNAVLQQSLCQQQLKQQTVIQQNTTQELELKLQRQQGQLLESQKSLLSLSPYNISRSEAFDYLSSFLYELSKIQAHISASSDIIGSNNYKLTYHLSKNLTRDNIEVKMNRTVIYVKASEGETVLFESIELLPAGMNLKEAAWQLLGDTLEILIPFHRDRADIEEKLCNVTNSTVKILPLANMNVDIPKINL